MASHNAGGCRFPRHVEAPFSRRLREPSASPRSQLPIEGQSCCALDRPASEESINSCSYVEPLWLVVCSKWLHVYCNSCTSVRSFLHSRRNDLQRGTASSTANAADSDHHRDGARRHRCNGSECTCCFARTGRTSHL